MKKKTAIAGGTKFADLIHPAKEQNQHGCWRYIDYSIQGVEND